MKRKILIYDFDGTLTNTPNPSYKIMSKLGYDNENFNNIISRYHTDDKLDFYTSYVKAYFEIFNESGEIPNIENICYGSKEISYLKGVFDFFDKYVMYDHFIVTSGFDIFVQDSDISKYFKKIFGTRFKFDNGVAYDIEYLLSDKEKTNIIKNIIKEENISGEDVIYLGDGLTDKYAMEYVKSIGGKAVYIIHNDEGLIQAKDFLNKNIIDNYFFGDYSIGSDLEKYISDFVNEKK